MNQSPRVGGTFARIQSALEQAHHRRTVDLLRAALTTVEYPEGAPVDAPRILVDFDAEAYCALLAELFEGQPDN